MCNKDDGNTSSAFGSGNQRVASGAGIQQNQRKNTRSQNRAGWGDRRSNSPNKAHIGM